MSLNSLVNTLIWYVEFDLFEKTKKNYLRYSFVLQPSGSINKEHGELLRWLADTRQRLTPLIDAPISDIQSEYKVTILPLSLSISLHYCLS